jgi:hypothetical protein
MSLAVCVAPANTVGYPENANSLALSKVIAHVLEWALD